MVDIQQIVARWTRWIEESWFYRWENWSCNEKLFQSTNYQMTEETVKLVVFPYIITLFLWIFSSELRFFFLHKHGVIVLRFFCPNYDFIIMMPKMPLFVLWSFFRLCTIYYSRIEPLDQISRFFWDSQSPFRKMLNNVPTLGLLAKHEPTVLRGKRKESM